VSGIWGVMVRSRASTSVRGWVEFSDTYTITGRQVFEFRIVIRKLRYLLSMLNSYIIKTFNIFFAAPHFAGHNLTDSRETVEKL